MKRLLKKANESKLGAFPALVEFPNSPIITMEPQQNYLWTETANKIANFQEPPRAQY